MNMGQLEKGVADFSKAIDLDPKMAQAWCNRGVVYVNMASRRRRLPTSPRPSISTRRWLSVVQPPSLTENLGQVVKAVADYARAFRVEPGTGRRPEHFHPLQCWPAASARPVAARARAAPTSMMPSGCGCGGRPWSGCGPT